MHRLLILIGLLLLVLASSMLTGCGAMFNGSTKSIMVNASPSGSTISAQPPIGEYTAPTTLSLERKNSYVLTFSKDGYKPANASIQKKVQFGIVFLDVFFTGLIGVVVDAATGAWNNLSPDQISISLEKIEGANIIGPDKIDIKLIPIDGSKSKTQWAIDCKESISVSIEKK